MEAVSVEDGMNCPGALFRVKVAVLGPAQCGKSSLIQCLLRGSVQSHTFCPPTEGVAVDLWTPFRMQGLQNLLNRKLTEEEHHLILELWDTSGRQVCQSVHGLFLTARTLCVIVFDVSDDKATEKVLALYRMIQQKQAGSPVIIVGNKVDLLDFTTVTSETAIKERLQHALLLQDDICKQVITMEMENTRTLLKDCRPNHKDNDTSTQRQPQKKRDCLPPQRSAEDPKELTVAQLHLTHLEQRLARAGGDTHLRFVTVSTSSGKGLDTFRQTLLEAALEAASFSSCSSTVRPSTVALYDQILALRERDVVVLPWQRFLEMMGEDGDFLGESFNEDMDFLASVGGVMEFKLGNISFLSQQGETDQTVFAKDQAAGAKDQVAGVKDHVAGLKDHAVTSKDLALRDKDMAPGTVETTTQAEERYVCVHPALLATAVCSCLVDDDKKSFRFEAGRFWPKDSGFKHPDPQMLCKVLETIPQMGLLKECLLPLLWQEYLLSEEQIVHMLHVLQSLGLLVHHSDQKKHCEGLALPHFPALSVHRCYALPLLNLLPDNRPQLNWTQKPFVGDIQVTWSFHLHAHAGLLQCLLGMLLTRSHQCSSYRHLWRNGVLLRVGEATVCAEQQGEERLDVACRVNGDELGREMEATRMLWVTLAPFVLHVRRFLHEWTGLHFKETVTALGQQFYLDEKVDLEPEVWVPEALCLWHRRAALTFMEGDTQHELDIKLLFPFKSNSSAVCVDGWLQLVMSHTRVILSDASVTMTSNLPSLSQEKSLKRFNMRNSVKIQRKKKSVEVKWQLEEENNNKANTTTIPADEPAIKGGKPSTKEDNSVITAITPITPEREGKLNEEPLGRVVSAQEEEAEAMRLASGFVAAILASAMADYIAQEAEADQDGRKLVSTAQIAAARVTAEAALAVQTGDIEGAATAVIDAVNAVKGNNSSSSKSETVKNHSAHTHSKLCVVL